MNGPALALLAVLAVSVPADAALRLRRAGRTQRGGAGVQVPMADLQVPPVLAGTPATDAPLAGPAIRTELAGPAASVRSVEARDIPAAAAGAEDGEGAAAGAERDEGGEAAHARGSRDFDRAVEAGGGAGLWSRAVGAVAGWGRGRVETARRIRALKPQLDHIHAQMRVNDKFYPRDDEALLGALERMSGFTEPAEIKAWLERAGYRRREAPRHAALKGQELEKVSATDFFRDAALWPHVETSVAAAIENGKRTGQRRLVLKSVGSSDGKEAYSLALTAEAMLGRAGENPDAWDVRVEAYDFNVYNLLKAESGRYYVTAETDKRVRRAFEYQAIMHTAPERLKRWIRPVWADLGDPASLARIEAVPGDVLLYRHVHYYLDPVVRHRNRKAFLTRRWAAGPWALLSYTDGPRGLPRPGDRVPSFASRVGADGRVEALDVPVGS